MRNQLCDNDNREIIMTLSKMCHFYYVPQSTFSDFMKVFVSRSWLWATLPFLTIELPWGKPDFASRGQRGRGPAMESVKFWVCSVPTVGCGQGFPLM